MSETNKGHTTAWQGFKNGRWNKHADAKGFIQLNYTPYKGSDPFLVGPAGATPKLWRQVMQLSEEERERGGMRDMDMKVASTTVPHDAGYLGKDLETIVGVQTERPFKHSTQPFGGIRTARAACEACGYELNEEAEKIFIDYRKAHNQDVFDAYSRGMLNYRRAGVITGLPDTYGRGRIISDYRRVALYDVDFLMGERVHDFNTISTEMSEDVIRLREELSEQYHALKELKELGQRYGFDLSRSAENFKEVVQWLYLTYLAAVKE